jgi:serine/threonine-protein phosphatase 2A regulatory subunit A
VNYFAGFLQDSESEVRTIAATRSGDFCKILDGPTIVKKILPALKKLATDPFVHVRKALAENLLSIAPLIGGANTSEHVVPMFLTLLKTINAGR